MIISLNSKQNSSMLPEIQQLLSSDIQAPLYYTVYERRHPLAIYNVSCATVLDNFNKVIAELHQLMVVRPFLDTSKIDWDTALLTSQKDLLYALMEYLEDCENILACFFPSEEIRNKDIRAKSYRSAVKEYRDHIGKIVNHLKHEQGRLRPIIFFNDELVLPGYFIEGPVAENFLGPVEKIHSGGNTAFSFARDLRYNFFHFYAVAKHLSNTIGSIISAGQTSDLPKNETPDKRVLEIASNISRLPLVFYPDEVSKPVPNVTVVQDSESDTTITLAYPDKETRIDGASKGMKIVVSYRGDGVTPSFRLPYREDANANKA
jgi:hypothetical protein